MKNVLHFIKYNNTVPIVLGVIFLGSGAAFAASDPQAVYSQQQQVVSVDNTYIANKDLTTWTPQVRITGVTEDADNYYVSYDLSTIDVVDYVWRDATKSQTMTVSKADLGVRDLGVYVTGQFRNIIGNELSYLRDVQAKAKNDLSQKVVATTYGGLVGKFLDATTETLPGYTPVVTPPSGNDGHDQVAAANSGAGSSGGSAPASGGSGGSSNLMSLQVLGANPARIAVGGGYVDLGVVLIDPTNPNIGYHAFVDGTPSDPPSIDTSTTSVHTIEYRATDQAGNQLMVRRVVIVGDASDPGNEVNTAGNVPSGPMPAAVVVSPVVATTTATTTTSTSTTTSANTSTPAPTNTSTAPAPADTATTTPPADTTTMPAADTAATSTSNEEASTTAQ